MKNKSKKIKEMLTIFSLTIFMVTSGLILLPSVEANTINVPTDYPTIQDAIDNANPGDTIIVASNTYCENKINIDKSLSIIGEDKNNTILDVEGMDYGFEITADSGITISGFKIINYANSGVWFHGTGVGSNSRISDNIFDPMISSIYGVRATYHHICDVEVINNEMYSVGVIAYRDSCSNWNISNNIIDLGNRNFHAIRAGGIDFIIKNNVITNSSHAIYASFNTAADWWIESNILFNNENGIELMGYNHQIQCNKIEQNKCGIVLKSVHESTIQENKILNNSDYGLKLLNIKNSTSINNLIFHNLFLNNSENAYDEGINRWDNDYPSGGNYWCDYTVTDEDSNGLGDIPYEIPGGDYGKLSC
jgi:parallel beta-helix repeat protein